MNLKFLKAVFLQINGTIGSGIFVLPYLFYHSNFLFATIFLVLLTIVTGVLNHFYLTIVTRTEGDHQLAGYVRLYLGRRYQKLAVINLVLLAFGAIATYQKLFSQFLHLLLPNLSLSTASIIFIFLTLIIFLSRDRLSLSLDLLIPLIMLAIPVILLTTSLSYPIPDFLSLPPSFAFYGAILFSLSGFTIIPEIEETLRGDPQSSKLIPYASHLGLIISSVVYLAFAYAVVSISSQNLSSDAITGIFKVIPLFGIIIAVFGLIATFKASQNFLLVIRELFFRDLHLPFLVSEILPSFLPLLTLTLTSMSVISIISLTGDITIFISGLLICLIYFKLNSGFKSQFLGIMVILALLIGLITSIL